MANIFRTFTNNFLVNYKNSKLLDSVKKKFPTCYLAPNIVLKGDLKNLELQKNVEIQSFSLLHLGGMDWCDHKGKLIIGPDSTISNHVSIWACGPYGVDIGKCFDCGPGVRIFSSRTDYNNPGNHIFGHVQIGNNVTVYANCVIGPEVSIGDNAVIAAGSVVIQDIPNNVLAGGAPAKVLKTI